MHYLKYLICCSLFFLACEPTAMEEEKEPKTEETNYEYDESLSLQDGFKAVVVAEEVGRARHIAVRDNGNIYIQLAREKGGNTIAALKDDDEDGKAETIEYFGNGEGTGVAIHGDHLYASSDEAVYRYDLPDEEILVPSDESRVLIAGGFPTQTSHQSKTFTLDDAGNLYVNVGAPSNACMEEARTKGSPGVDPCPQRDWQASIWKFSADKTAQQQQSDARQYAAGIRNAVAIEWNPTTNNLFALQHGRDQLHQFFPDLYTTEESAELPSEEFLSIQDGDDFGWPYCYYDHKQSKKLLAPEYGGDKTQQGRCAEVTQPILAFPGHLAPNDLMFYTGNQFPARYKNGAFIAFHGSWNRAPQEQEGYFVVFVPMENGKPSGEWEVFADDFAGVESIGNPKEAQHRPCGLAQGPDGSLYIADSVKGKVWRIVYEG
ncbi:MAG: PQQ-dependent sugar dehydrogenase [Bacteroidota bacterium]